MFRFATSIWLWALLAVPALVGLYMLAAGARRRALERFADLELVVKLTESVSVRARRVKAGLIIGAVGLLVVAAARPQFGTRVETVQARGQDIVIAVDLSQSMLAEDVAPSRLERAQR